MPLLYGEGEVKAFQRLQEAIDKPLKGKSYPYNWCLTHLIRSALSSSSGPEKDLFRHLPYAKEAPFNAYDRQDEPACLPKTRVDLL